MRCPGIVKFFARERKAKAGSGCDIGPANESWDAIYGDTGLGGGAMERAVGGEGFVLNRMVLAPLAEGWTLGTGTRGSLGQGFSLFAGFEVQRALESDSAGSMARDCSDSARVGERERGRGVERRGWRLASHDVGLFSFCEPSGLGSPSPPCNDCVCVATRPCI